MTNTPGDPPPEGDPPAGEPQRPPYSPRSWPPPGQPAWGHPGTPPPYQPPPFQHPPGTNGWAIACLVLGALAVVPIAIITGIVALIQIRRRPQPGRMLVIVGLAACVVWTALIAGIVVLVDQTTADRENGEIVEAGSIDPFDLRVGDCFMLPENDEEVLSVDGVPCAESHDVEVIEITEMADADEYPGDEAVFYKADYVCVQAFNEYVGKPYRGSELELYNFHPTEESWDLRNDREIVCGVYDPAGKTTGETLKGARR